MHSPRKSLTLSLLSLTLLVSAALANHPVLVEGNSDSPVPNTAIVTANSSGDFDGDGRVRTAEDTDGADRIFGTIKAALGNGTGAAAGTGANLNGTVTIVASGRYYEIISIDPITVAVANPGNVTLEAAPGVSAQINAVFQGDPEEGNGTRQNATGITIDMPATSVVTLRNLVIRNFATGIVVKGVSRVNIENCVIENNRDYGIQVSGNARVRVSGCRIIGTGFRRGAGVGVDNTPVPGTGIEFARGTKGFLSNTSVSQSFGLGLKSPGGVSRTLFTQFDNNRGAE